MAASDEGWNRRGAAELQGGAEDVPPEEMQSSVAARSSLKALFSKLVEENELLRKQLQNQEEG